MYSMDWTLAIERNREALAPYLAAMLAMAGLVAGRVLPGTLPRSVYRAILAMLRPAEACVRRVIAVAAREGIAAIRAQETLPATRGRQDKGRRKGKGCVAKQGDRVPPFALFDPRRSTAHRRRTAPGEGPRIWFFDGFDPPRVTRPVPGPDDPVPALRLCRRILALRMALEDVSGQAERLVRVLSRRSCRYRRPMRPGRPPGHRERGRAPLDALLAECQTLALWALHRPARE